MARRSSRSARYGRKRRSYSVYLAIAAIACAAIVYIFVFRGGPSGPQDAAAGAIDAGNQADLTTASEVSETKPDPTPVSGQSPTASQGPAPQAAEPAVASPEPEPPRPAIPEPEAALAQTTAVKPDNAAAEAIVAQAQALLDARPRQIIAARDKLNQALAMPMPAERAKAIKVQMAELSKQWLFGPAVIAGDPLCDTYTVKRGDSLAVIGNRFKVPYETLMKINNIPRPESLQAGRAIKVVKGPFHVKVYRSTFTMDLYLGDTYVRSFKVGIGRSGHETPTGTWRVQEHGKLVKPTWTDPDTGRVYKASDPDYPLGSRWIALDGVDGAARGRTGFAIHGTKDPDQIGGAVSRGCIRMYNGEAILVYNLMFPLYSKVEVLD